MLFYSPTEHVRAGGARALRGVIMPRAAIINYGVGNLFSIKRSLERAGFNVIMSSDKRSLSGIDAIVLPGVGNFGAGAENIRRLKDDLLELIREGIPVLCVCLGMQLLFKESEESSGEGLSILSGKVIKLPSSVRIPHMGWNTLKDIKPVDILDSIGEKDYFYFAHSYYAVPVNEDIIAAKTEYGVKFASVIAQKNIFGVQFHPEKSGKPGEKLIKNFMEIVKG
ncbi:MAG: imidazole glycerol phosphate synthase subunit HisH [Candidatus Bathyarchaeia archaeon]